MWPHLRAFAHAVPLSHTVTSDLQMSAPSCHSGLSSNITSLPPYLKYLCPNPHTRSHCLVSFSSTYHFLKLSYLSIRLFTNCLSPNFNEGRGLLSPVPGMSPVHIEAVRKHLMNEKSEGSWAQSHHFFFKKGTKEGVLHLFGPGSLSHGTGTMGCIICYQAAAWAIFKSVGRKFVFGYYTTTLFLGVSLIVQLIKNLPAVQETPV